ncbi:unnamed protein product [Merluccius merluccius]
MARTPASAYMTCVTITCPLCHYISTDRSCSCICEYLRWAVELPEGKVRVECFSNSLELRVRPSRPGGGTARGRLSHRIHPQPRPSP